MVDELGAAQPVGKGFLGAGGLGAAVAPHPQPAPGAPVVESTSWPL